MAVDIGTPAQGNSSVVLFVVVRDAIPPYVAITVPARSGSPAIPVEQNVDDM